MNWRTANRRARRARYGLPVFVGKYLHRVAQRLADEYLDDLFDGDGSYWFSTAALPVRPSQEQSQDDFPPSDQGSPA